VRAIEPGHFPWFDYARYTFSLGLEHEGCAWLSGHSASEYDPASGHIVVRGGMTEQTRTSYAKIAAILQAAGLGVGDARRIVEYVTADGIDRYAEAAAVRDEVLGGAQPAVCTVVVNSLLRPQAWIEIEVTAGKGPADDVVYLSSITGEAALHTARERLAARGAELAKTVWYTTPDGPLPPAVGCPSTHVVLSRLQRPDVGVSLDAFGRTGTSRTRFLPGLTGHGDDVVAQAESVFEQLAEVAAGAALVKTIEFVTAEHLPRYREVAKVRERFLSPPYPASTGAICEALPGGAGFLVDAIAVEGLGIRSRTMPVRSA
jgi:enamine deaminase RidA (YjgF/YER057c/UK114 family)